MIGGIAGIEASALPQRCILRIAADGGFGIFLDAGFVLDAIRPPNACPAFIGNDILELFVILGFKDAAVAESDGFGKHIGLDLIQQGCNRLGDALLLDKALALFAGNIAAGEDDSIVGSIARSDLYAQWYTAHLPIVELEARGEIHAVIDFEPEL